MSEPPVARFNAAYVTFTGRLAAISRQEARELLQQVGGIPVHHVSRHVSFVVVGMHGWPLLPDGQISRKLRQAERLRAQGHPLEILSESAFLEHVGRREQAPSYWKVYSAEEIRRMVGVDTETLRRLEQLSLIRSQDSLYDFLDILSLKTVLGLIHQGVRIDTITRSLERLGRLIPDRDRPLAQLKIVSDAPDSLLADLGGRLLAPDGQLTFDFHSTPTAQGEVIPLGSQATPADAWIQHGNLCEEEGRWDEAREAYEKALEHDPDSAEIAFNLGNALRELQRLPEAEAQFLRAIARDPDLAAAWYNLADLQSRNERYEAAVDSLKRALHLDPAFADACFNLAAYLEESERPREAARYWARYLELDPASSWARIAKDHLESPVDG